MRFVATALCALGIFLASLPAAADRFNGARFEMAETAHYARVVFDRGSARITIRRTAHNPGDRSDEGTWHIDMPSGAVATGLRTAGFSKAGAPLWFEGELMEAEAAAAKYKELTGRGGFYPKDPALLSWRSAHELALQVFPVLGRSDKTVEYTLVVPTRYDKGEHSFELPATTKEGMLPAVVSVAAARPGDVVVINGVPADASTKVKLDRDLVITLRPQAPQPFEGTLGSLAVSGDKAITHARLQLAARISRVPDDAAIVVVIDASRSMVKHQASAFAAARSFLSHFRSASVDIVTFDRKVHRLTRAAVSPANAVALLAKHDIESANGSQVDDALAFADALLAARPHSEKRILLLSDLMMRDDFRPQRLALRALESHALLHIAQINESAEASLTRDDEHLWAPVANKTGGVFWQAAHPDRVDPQTRAVMEEWARPVRLDDARIKGIEVEDFPAMLTEGQGFESWAFEASARPTFTIDGLLWSRPLSVRVSRSEADTKRSSALVFGSPLLGDLTEPEMTVLAFKGAAVSPVTSYLAIEPGVRPSTEGLEEGEGVGLGRMGTGGGGVGFGVGLGSTRRRFDLAGFLQRTLAPEARRCGATATVHVALETTPHEIVDVKKVAQDNQRSAAVEACMREAAWGVDLPADYDGTTSIEVAVDPV